MHNRLHNYLNENGILNDYKQLFEKTKKDSKKKYFQEKISFYKNEIKNTWETLEDVIGKTKINENFFQKR